MQTCANETIRGIQLQRVRNRGSAARLLLASLVLGTMLGLGVVASLKSHEAAENPGTVVQPGPTIELVPASGGDPNQPASDGNNLSTAAGNNDGSTASTSVPFQKTQTNLVTRENAPAVNSGSTNLTKRELENRLDQASKLDQIKEETLKASRSRSAAIYQDLSVTRVGGEAPLKRGQTFQLQLALAGVDTPLSSYTMEARWNPNHLQVEKVEGLKGGFAAPGQVDLSNPGQATWTAAEASPTMNGDVVIALVSCKVLQDSPASTRIFLTPRTIQSMGANQTPRSTAGVGKAIGLTVE